MIFYILALLLSLKSIKIHYLAARDITENLTDFQNWQQKISKVFYVADVIPSA